METLLTNEPSLPTRIMHWFQSIPFFTRCVFLLCVSLYLTQLFLGWDPAYTFQLDCASVYRVFTSAFFHVGLLHLTFNMLALIPIAGELERRYGTVKFLYLIFLIIVLAGALYVLITALLTAVDVLRTPSCSLGFSGVIFGLIAIYTQTSNSQQYSIFGFFPVPARIYPWALLVFWQLLLPGLSFIGHLSGLLVGQMYAWGWLTPLELSQSVITKLERSYLFALCSDTQSFILQANIYEHILPTTHAQPSRTENADTWGGFFRRIGGFSSEGGNRGEASQGSSSARNQGRFPGEAKYLTSDPYGQASIPVITEQPDSNDAFDQLVEMGFDAPSVRAALLTSNNDFTIAMNKLTGQS